MCFVETKLDDTDIISLPDFQYISQPRKQAFLRRSGGIAFCFKEHLAKFVKHLDSDSDYIMWIQIDKCLMKADENIILGLSYIPPIQSKYYNDKEIFNLEINICMQSA